MGQPLWKTVQLFLKKINILLLYNVATMFLDIYSNELKIMSTQKSVPEMFVQLYLQLPALGINQNVLLVNEWTNKLWCI